MEWHWTASSLVGVNTKTRVKFTLFDRYNNLSNAGNINAAVFPFCFFFLIFNYLFLMFILIIYF